MRMSKRKSTQRCPVIVTLVWGGAMLLMVMFHQSNVLLHRLNSESAVNTEGHRGVRASPVVSKTFSGPAIRDDLTTFWAERIWEDLLKEASRLQKAGKSPGGAMEVGMHRASKFQCFS